MWRSQWRCDIAIETPRHAEYACEETHPGKTHDEWIAHINKNVRELESDEDRSEDAAFIGKITLGTDPSICGAPHPSREGVVCLLAPHSDDILHDVPQTEERPMMQIDPSDAQKILDILADNEEYHTKRDEMNAAIHRSTDRVRYSPLTVETTNQRERLSALMREQGVPQ